MDYFLLVVSGFLFSSEFIFIKLYEQKSGSDYKATVKFTLISGIMMLLILLCLNGFTVEFSLYSILMAAFFAIINVVANLLGIKAVSIGSVALFTLFMMSGGTVLPFLTGIWFLNEQAKLIYIIATILLLIALILPVFDKNERKGNSKKGFIIFLAICTVLFILNGANGIVGKVHQINQNAVSTIDFLTIKYMFRVVFGLIMLFTCPMENKFKGLLEKNALFSGFGYALVHVFGMLIQLYCALTVDACFMYPLTTGSCLIFTPVLALVLFKEKINIFVGLEILISVIATVLFVF